MNPGDDLSGAFDDLHSGTEPLGEGAVWLKGFVRAEAPAIFKTVETLAAGAPFRHMVTPGGFTMSVAMTNCGDFGWTTDAAGYRYAAHDPVSGRRWPAMPDTLRELGLRAARAGGYPDFDPDSCLINRYEPGARMSLHQDRNERDLDAPIVSVSLGLTATFLFGGLERTDPTRRIRLENGDVVVWGGPSRLAFHGIAPLAAGEHPLTGPYRFNLTFRKTR